MRSMEYYGWKPDFPNRADAALRIQFPAMGLPPAVDLRAGMPPVYDQSTLGSCTCNAGAAVVDYERKRQGLAFMNPSRLWLYYKVRELEGSLGSDSGAQPRDVLTILATQGVPHETDWP